MNTMYRKRMQLSVVTVAALAIAAVAAVALMAGGTTAQATAPDGSGYVAPQRGGDDTPGGGDSTPTPTPTTEPTPTPRTHATPEPCPGETGNANTEAAPAVDSGHIALFDVWWNTDELELTNTSCPPTVAHGEEDVRTPSSINIDETIIHIPNSAMVPLTETDYPKAKYEKVWDADDAENPNGDGDRIVWALPACPDSPATTSLCLSFSAALLNSTDWKGDIVYHVDHVHQVDIDKQDPRYVLVYDAIDDRTKLRWDSSDARVSQMPVAPGAYDRPMWFFTSRGAYQFQVHITGEPELDSDELGGLDPITNDSSVNSDVREYTIHVGAEADLAVDVEVEPDLASGDTTLDPGEDVTIEVTASNAGPDTAPNTEVEVLLPDGLTHSTDPTKVPTASAGTYDSATGVWSIANFLVTDDSNTDPDDDPETLTITATVGAATRGEMLKVKATISAMETLHIKEIKRDENGNPLKDENGQYQLVDETYHVPVPDKVSGNNMDMDTVTVPTIPNVDPMFQIKRSVPENSPAGITVGDPVGLKEPDAGNTLTFGLTGDGAGNFAVAADANGDAQITVANSAHLNYEHKQSYDLVMTVSDGKDANGDADSTIDDSIPVHISLEDVAETTATLQATKGDGFITWTFTVANPPTGATNVTYRFSLRDTTTELLGGAGAETRNSLSESFTHNDSFNYASGTYRVEGDIQYDEGGTTHYVHPDISGDQTITIP